MHSWVAWTLPRVVGSLPKFSGEQYHTSDLTTELGGNPKALLSSKPPLPLALSIALVTHGCHLL